MGSADDGESLDWVVLLLAFQDLGRSHVDEPEVAFVVNHEVFGLYIPVNDVVVVQVLDDGDHGPYVELCIVGSQQSKVPDDVVELLSPDILEHKINIHAVFERFDVLDDEWEMDDLEDLLFLGNELFQVLLTHLGLVEALQHVQLSVEFRPAQVHWAKLSKRQSLYVNQLR